MFESLSEKLSGILDKLTGRGALSEEDVNAAMREVRRALLEADVALEVVRSFVDRTRTKAVGASVIKSVKPGQMVVKIVHDSLVETLGGDSQAIDLNAPAPVAIMLVGLQGAGKTTTAAKIAKRLAERDKRKVLMASLDVKRPAAQEQLAVLGQQVGVDTLPIIPGQDPVAIARRAEQAARLQGYDVVLLDTAGRTHIDEPLMQEMADIRDAAKPHEVLLVADALTGQDAVNLAKNFNERVGLTGIVLTRMDGDGRGGAALSMRAVTGKPIKLLGVGEKMDAVEDFHPARLADRILGMGDIVSLVEKAAQTIDAAQAARMAEKLRKGVFDLNDLSEQLAQIEKLGGMGGIMGMLPGVAKIKDQLNSANLDDKFVKRQRAIISSMTPQERRNPDILKASRKKRIAAGSGVNVEQVNRLLKQHRQMADMMKTMGGAAGKRGGMMGKLGQMMGLGGGMPMPTPEQIEAMQKQMGGGEALGPPPERPAFPPPRRPAPSTCRRSSPASAPASCRASAAASIRSGRRSDSALETERLILREGREADLDPGRFYADEESSKPVGGPLNRTTCGGAWPSTAATGRCAASATGPSKKSDRRLRRLVRPLVPGRFSRARGRVGADASQAWPRLRHRSRDARADLRLRNPWVADRDQPHRPGQFRSIRVAERLGATLERVTQYLGMEFAVYRHPSARSLASHRTQFTERKKQCP